jgi:hypothetical protein
MPLTIEVWTNDRSFMFVPARSRLHRALAALRRLRARVLHAVRRA